MEHPARKREFSFDPRADDPAVREQQRQQQAEWVREWEAEHGPVDPDELAKLRAQAETWPT